MKILLVEDAAAMRQLIQHMLDTMGYTDVVEAEDGEDAWEKLQAEKIDLLMTDKQMPGMDGLELVHKVRQMPQYERLPILMFSGYNDVEEVRVAVKSGIDTYLAKPFTPEQLAEKLNGLGERQSTIQVGQIIQGQVNFQLDNANPKIVFCEAASSAKQLQQPHHQSALQFLWAAVCAIDEMNRVNPDLNLEYTLKSDVREIARLIQQLQESVKVLTISPSTAGGVTLARLASVNKSELRVLLVCDVVEALSAKERAGLEDLDVFIMKRGELSEQSLMRLFREFAGAESHTLSATDTSAPDDIQERIETDIKNMATLPVLPEVYREISKLDRNPSSDIAAWATVIDRDPLSSAMVVRRARSPIYGFQSEIVDTKRAVTLLGKKSVKELIVCQAVKQAFSRVKEIQFDVEDYWIHSLAVAVTARILSFSLDRSAWSSEQEQEFNVLGIGEDAWSTLEEAQLAPHFSLTAKDDPFAAGMMHDIGRVAMVMSYPGLFSAVLEELEAQSWKVPMLEAEKSVAGGITHASVGGFLAAEWGLNSALIRVTGQHHDFAAYDHLSRLIFLADFIGGAAYPFPKQAQYPAVEILNADGGTHSQEDLKAAGAFLPENLLERFNIELAQFLDLGRVLLPAIKHATESLRQIA